LIIKSFEQDGEKEENYFDAKSFLLLWIDGDCKGAQALVE
jgi:hypothetical protein